jgi:hypothetical protein
MTISFFDIGEHRYEAHVCLDDGCACSQRTTIFPSDPTILTGADQTKPAAIFRAELKRAYPTTMEKEQCKNGVALQRFDRYAIDEAGNRPAF